MKFSRRSLYVSLLGVGLSVAACGAQPDAGSETTTFSPPAEAVVSEAVENGDEARQAAEPASDSIPSTTEAPAQGGDLNGDDVPDALALSPLSSQVVELPSAFPERVLDGLGELVGAPPVSISLPSLDVNEAQIIPVGLEENGELEVPGADTVGWYQFGVGVGGGQGSAVLAAHIAYNGRNGVFVALSEAEIGDEVVVDRAGQDITYRVESITQYGKFDLPIDDLFRETGDERLVLITCGGSFNPSLRSYDDNVVVIATPVV